MELTRSNISEAALSEISNYVESGLNNISKATQQLDSLTSIIQANAKALDKDIQSIYMLSDNINEVSKIIKKIADETNILGFNSSIEAAKAGTYGSGFNVVSQEMRKLSVQSKNAVSKINELTDSIKTMVKGALEKSNISLDSSLKQNISKDEITTNIEELTKLVRKIK